MSEPESAELRRQAVASETTEPPTLSLPPGLERTQSLRGLSSEPAPAFDGESPLDFGDYEIVRKIASGGMGVVYEARQRSLQRTVALKMIRAADLASNEEVARFYAEAEAAAGLRHPHIVAVYEVGRWGDAGHYFTMDYIAGQSLTQLNQHQIQSPERTAALLIKVVRAIHFAHEKGILHRDLKPSNILLDEDGEPRVADFGLAKRWQSDSGHTVDGMVLGTPSYMPPEQARGEQRALCPASDVYSLGAVLYECLTGRPPFVASHLADLLGQVIHDEPVPPARLVPRLPRDLETICLKCLEKDPAKRYKTAAALADDLERYMRDEPILARPVGAFERAGKFVRRKPAWAALAGAIIGAIVTVLAISISYSRTLAAKNSQLTNTIRKLDKALIDVKQESDRATTQSNLATERYDSLRRNSYAMQVQQADNYYWADPPNLPRAEELLLGLRPQADEQDLRGLEWHFLQRLLQHKPMYQFQKPVQALQVQTDGSLLIYSRGGGERLSSVQHTTNGQTTQRNFITPEWLDKLAFSRSADLMVCVLSDGTVDLRRISDPAEIVATVADKDTDSTSGHFTRVAIADDGQRVLWVRRDGVLHLWNVDEQKEERLFETKATMPEVVCLSPDNRWVALMSQQSLLVIDLVNDRQMTRAAPETKRFRAAAIAPDSSTLAVIHNDSRLELLPLAENSKSRYIPLPRLSISPTNLAFLSDSKSIAASSYSGILVHFHLETNRMSVRRGHRGPIACIVAGREPYQFFTGSNVGEVMEWDARVTDQRAQVIKPLHPEDNHASFTSLSYSPNGRFLLCGGRRYSLPGDPQAGCLFFYDTADFSRRRWDTPDSVDFCKFSPDGQQVLWRERSVSGEATARRRSFVWQDLKMDPEPIDQAVAAADFVAGGGLVIGNDNGLRLATEPDKFWAAQEKRTRPLRIRELFADPTGQVVGSFDLDFILRIWNVHEQREIVWSTGHSEWQAFAISANGRFAAWAAPDVSFRKSFEKEDWSHPSPETEPTEWAPHHRAVVFDLQKKRIQFIVGGHAREVRALALSTDGSRLLSGDGSGVLKLWDTSTGNELLSLSASSMGVHSVAIHPLNKQFASLTNDGEIAIWHCE